MRRMLCLVAGLAGAAGLSQFPEFSQQYLQRLGGQVDALTLQLKEFDATALAEQMGREEMLERMAATPPFDGQAAMWRQTMARQAILADNLNVLRDASPLGRLLLVHRMADAQTVQATWAEFSPAVPVSVAGVATAGTGFLGGWAAVAAVLAAMTAPLRRFKRTSAPAPKRREPGVRTDPPVVRPTLVTQPQSHIPRLSGAQR